MIEKSTNDDQYITALKKAVKKLQRQVENLKQNNIQDENVSLNLERNCEKIQNLQKKNQELERQLLNLNQEINKYKQNPSALKTANFLVAPLKKQYVNKITELEKKLLESTQKIQKIESMNQIPLTSDQNLKDLSKENMKLRMKIQSLEQKLYSQQLQQINCTLNLIKWISTKEKQDQNSFEIRKKCLWKNDRKKQRPQKIQERVKHQVKAKIEEIINYQSLNRRVTEFNMFAQKKEDKKMMLDEQIQVKIDDLKQLQENVESDRNDDSDDDDDASQDNESNEEIKETKIDKIINDMQSNNLNRKVTTSQEYKVLTGEKYDEFLNQNLTSFEKYVKLSEQRFNAAMSQDVQMSKLIEDYINNQDKDIQEQRGGCTVRKIEDNEMENNYMANDFLWLSNPTIESEKIAVAFVKDNHNPRVGNINKNYYLLNIYTQEKRLLQKQSRSNIKKLTCTENSDEEIWGGMENGRIAFWDLRSQEKMPDLVSLVSENSNFLPIIDIKKKDQFLFSIGLEGRICKWDARKLEQPIMIQDIFCLSEKQNLAQLEAMPLGFDICDGNNDIIYVNTVEGSVYEMQLTPNAIQQRSFFANLHDGPITNFQTVDFKSYFKEYNDRKKNTFEKKPKYLNFYLTSSFDWSIKLWKQNMTDSLTFKFHNDFVSALAVNNQVSPFCFASGDSEGKVAIWKLGTKNADIPIFVWENQHAISKCAWNQKGIKLGITDVNGCINVITFPKSKIIYSDKVLQNFASNEIRNLSLLK